MGKENNFDERSDIEHQLRNTLTSLLSSGELLENYIITRSDPDKQLRHVRIIRQSTEDLIIYLEDLLTVE